MKKVLQLCKYYPPIFGGIELVELMISKAFTKNKNEVFIHAFSKKSSEEKGKLDEKITFVKENFRFLNAPFNIKYFFYFKKSILQLKPNIIFVHLPNPLMHELVRFHHRVLKKKGIELIAIYHSDIFNKGIIGNIYNFYIKHTLRMYDKIVVSSENLWNSSQILNSFNPEKKVVIPFCIDEEPVVPEIKKKNYFLAIGRGVNYKGFEMLIETFNSTDLQNKELVILTGGENVKKYRSLAKSNIKILENVSHQEKNKFLSEAKALIVSSNSQAEAYGMIIVEAFFYETPVIATRIPTGVTFLVNEERGALFDIDNREELKSIIINFNDDDFKLKSVKAKKFYKEELSFDSFSERMVDI